MSHRRIPDEAGITNHYSASFGSWITEGNFLSITGLKDATEVIDGPDMRGYNTGKPERQTLTVVVATNDPTASQMNAWKRACESGNPLARSGGAVSQKTAGDIPVAEYELTDCLCYSVSASDLGIESPEVAQETFEISYSRLVRTK